MRRPPRIAVLIVLLAGVADWVAMDLRGAAGPTAAKTPAPGTSLNSERSGAPAAEAKQPGIPSRFALGRFASDPFSPHSWTPRAKPAPVAEAPAPVAPPLPFRFAGQLQRDSGIEVYLARGEEIFTARQVDTLDGQYKVDSVNATEGSFVHLPTGTRQTLQFSALKDHELSSQGASPLPRAPSS